MLLLNYEVAEAAIIHELFRLAGQAEGESADE